MTHLFSLIIFQLNRNFQISFFKIRLWDIQTNNSENKNIKYITNIVRHLSVQNTQLIWAC